MKRTLITTAALALAGGLMLAACGNDQPTTSTGTDGASTTVEMMDDGSDGMTSTTVEMMDDGSDGMTSTTVEMMEPTTTGG